MVVVVDVRVVVFNMVMVVEIKKLMALCASVIASFLLLIAF